MGEFYWDRWVLKNIYKEALSLNIIQCAEECLVWGVLVILTFKFSNSISVHIRVCIEIIH